MKLYLHIGQQKTGSTSIQKFFEINRKNLLKAGYIYPSSLGLDKQYDIYKNIDELLDENSDLHKSFIKEISKSGCKNIIFSEENVFILKDDLLDKLTTFIHKHFNDITIIAYLRRQDQQAASLYQEVVKGKVHLKYEKWIGKKIDNQYYDYFHVIQRWHNRFPSAKFKIRAFNNLIKDDIRRDILDAINFEKSDLLNFNEKFNFRNTAIDTLSIELLRISNRYIKKGKVDDVEKFRKKIRAFISKKPFDKKLNLHYPQKLRLWEVYKESNKKLVEEYGIKGAAYLLDKPENTPGWTSDDHKIKEVIGILNSIYKIDA